MTAIAFAQHFCYLRRDLTTRSLHIKIRYALKTPRREILFSLLAYEICLPYSLSDGSYFEKTTRATGSCCCRSPESKVDLNEDPWP